MEDDIGSIETGKLADLVVLDDDLFAMDPKEIHGIRPVAVIMEGKVIHGSLP
jgi:predicted amidohydrolase YtcJ